jgi:hypothetical protein
MLQAPEGQVSSARVTLLAIVQLLDNGSDILYITTAVFATGRLYQLCAIFIAAPTAWYLVLLWRLKLSVNRVWSYALYGDPYSDDTMRAITPLAALERPGPPVQERERMHIFWWWATAPAVLLARPALLRCDALARQAEHSPAALGLLGFCRFCIRALVFCFVAATLPFAFGASALAAVGYVLALGPIMLRLEMLSSATTANRFFMRCDPRTPTPLNAVEMAFLFQTRGMSHVLMQSVPQILLIISNVQALQAFTLPAGVEQFSRLSKVTLAFSIVSAVLNLAHWASSYLQFREVAGKRRTTLAKNMAHWDRLNLLNGPGAVAFTDASSSVVGADADAAAGGAPIAASAAAILPVLSGAAAAAAAVPPQRSSRAARAAASAVVDRFELLLADVRRGALVELKPDAPAKFRADAPGSVLLPGARGVVDEDAPCVNPYIIWDGGAGRVFFHISDLYLIVPAQRRGLAAAMRRQRRSRSDALNDVVSGADDDDEGDAAEDEGAAPAGAAPGGAAESPV